MSRILDLDLANILRRQKVTFFGVKLYYKPYKMLVYYLRLLADWSHNNSEDSPSSRSIVAVAVPNMLKCKVLYYTRGAMHDF